MLKACDKSIFEIGSRRTSIDDPKLTDNGELILHYMTVCIVKKTELAFCSFFFSFADIYDNIWNINIIIYWALIIAQTNGMVNELTIVDWAVFLPNIFSISFINLPLIINPRNAIRPRAVTKKESLQFLSFSLLRWHLRLLRDLENKMIPIRVFEHIHVYSFPSVPLL